MQLLVVEEDPNLARVMNDVLLADGHTVLGARDGRGALAAVASARPQVMVIAQDLGDMAGTEVVGILRQRDGQHTRLPIVLLAFDVGNALRSECESLGIERILPKPFSILDLSDIIRVLGARVPGAEPTEAPPARPIHAGNAAELARLWSRRATGVLRVEQPNVSAWVLFAQGGPVGTDGMQAVHAALEGGALELEPCDVDGFGDRDGLGRTLWAAAHAWVATQPLPPIRAAEVAPNRLTETALELPVKGHTRAALKSLEGRTALGTVVHRLRADARELLVDFTVLATLGFVQLQAEGGDLPEEPPEPRVRRPPDRTPYPHLPNDSLAARAVAEPPTEPSLSRDRSRLQAGPLAVDRFHDTSGISLWPDEDRPTDPGIRPLPAASRGLVGEAAWMRDLGLPPAPTLPGGGEGGDVTDPRVPGPTSPRETVVGSLPSVLFRSLAPARSEPAPRPVVNAAELAQQILRLRREAGVVERADPYTVLGIPRSAPQDLVARAGERMQNRYDPLTRSPNAEVRQLAIRILAKVREAITGIANIAKVEDRAETEYIRRGTLALDRGEWSEADHWFAAARELVPGSPEVLAHLGWSRFHNPSIPRDEREEEGVTLLQLATQFDANYAAGHYLLAQALHESGDSERSLLHLRHVLRLSPAHPEATALARRLKSA